MKKTLLLGTIAAFGALILLPSCDESMFTDPNGNSAGHIIPTVSVDNKVTSSQKNIQSKAVESRAEAQTVSLDDLVLTLRTADGSVAFTCTGVGNFPTDKEFKVGTYTFEAAYGDPKDEGFELPAYFGSSEIKVEENKTTSVSLQASLANSMVSVVFGENLLNYATGVSAALQTTGDDIVFETTESRPAYIMPAMTAVKVSLTKPNGTSGTLTAATFTAKARTHHTVKIDIAGGAGDAVLEITFDDTVEEEDVEIDLSDEILNAPAPEVTIKGFESGEPVGFIPGLSSTGEMSMDIIAKATLKSVMMTTTGNALLQTGWPESIDLMAASEAQQQQLKALGLDVLGLYRNPDKMAVIDFTGVPKNIAYSEKAETVEITVTVFDRGSKSSEPVTLVLAPEPLLLELVAESEVYPGAGEDMEFTLTFNGNNPAEEVNFQFNNNRGTWTSLTPKSVEAVDGQENTFKVVLSAPDSDEDVKVRAYCPALNKYSGEVTIKKVPFKLQGNENDVWATHATLTTVVTDDKYDANTVAQNGTVSLTPAEGSVSVKDGAITFTGLTPGKTYSAVITYEGMTCRPFEFTTEEALQLPESGFDNWTSEKKGDYQYLWTVGDGSVWNTLNELTTSTASSSAGATYAYKATSGTIPANGRSSYSQEAGTLIGIGNAKSEGHTNGEANIRSDKNRSNTNAALIRTVGWGSDNTATSGGLTVSRNQGFGTCRNKTIGELFLGSYVDGSTNYGMEFNSRPSTLRFYYCYVPSMQGNGDKGLVEIRLVDEDGTQIASSTSYLEENFSRSSGQKTGTDYTPTYEEKVINITYPDNAKKAKKIIVVFKSSAGEIDYTSNNTNFWNTPGGRNLSGGEYVGSELYIDDVQLTY